MCDDTFLIAEVGRSVLILALKEYNLIFNASHTKWTDIKNAKVFKTELGNIQPCYFCVIFFGILETDN